MTLLSILLQHDPSLELKHSDQSSLRLNGELPGVLGRLDDPLQPVHAALPFTGEIVFVVYRDVGSEGSVQVNNTRRKTCHHFTQLQMDECFGSTDCHFL